MDSSSVYYSATSPTYPKSRLSYPNPYSADSASHRLADLPIDASEDVLVTIPGAVVHLIDSQGSVHLGSGDFSLVRLSQSGNGIAVFVRVGGELQWPVTVDEGSFKLDDSHYVFSLHVPPEIEQECRAAPEESGLNADASSADNILNYGVTFAPGSNVASLQLLDEVLKQYTSFSIPDITQTETGKGIPIGPRKSNYEEGSALTQPAESGKESMMEDAALERESAAYWTSLAPNVDDYTRTIPRAIAAGARQIIKGIFLCSEATVAQLEKRSLHMKGKVTPKQTPTKISPSTMRRIRRVKRISVMSQNVSGCILSGALKTAEIVTKPLSPSKGGQKLRSHLPGQIALASLDGFGKICDVIEVAGKNVLSAASTVTTGLVSQRYGNEAAELTHEGLHTAGGFLSTAYTVTKLRKVFYPSNMAKHAAKATGKKIRKQKASPQNEE